MKVKIFEMLKTKCANMGFSKEVLEGVATNLSAFVTEETQIEPAVNGAELMLKSFQSYADNRVNTFKNESEKYKKEAEELKVKLANEGKSTSTAGQEQDVPQWVKELMESHKQTQEAVLGLQKEKKSQTLTNQFVEQMKNKGIPEFYYTPILRGREFANIEAVEHLVASTIADYQTLQTEGVKAGFTYVKPPEGGANPQKDEDAIAQMIKQGTEKNV
ncbi:hypothetical protein ACIRNY_11070 [Capnocytophaga canimorsus]|uniref:hypothetical protein n=1 Tax=Capnocytophaga canimorsus TaxID=28188 RepID=UPI00384B0E36